MSKKLAGVTLIYKGQSQDYCFKESIKSMLEFCDHVYVTYIQADSDDGTHKVIMDLIESSGGRLSAMMYTEKQWNEQQGKEKLSFFTNVAIQVAEKSGYEYVYSQQMDEITNEKSYKAIREAVEEGGEGYAISRINLWGSPFHKLIVPQERKPCSTTIVRLAKAKYRAYGDAESLAVDNPSTKFHDEIRMYHLGFVRKREVMVNKIKHMQEKVFGITADEKLKGMVIFEPWAWFDKEEDLALIDEPLPEIIKGWADARVYND